MIWPGILPGWFDDQVQVLAGPAFIVIHKQQTGFYSP
jgi:hypothetical protein